MTNLKEIAEILLRAHHSESSFNNIVTLMNSSSNTVKHDIDKLRDGAKLEVTFDIDKIYEIAELIESEIQSARDDASNAVSYAEEVHGRLDEVDYEMGKLLAMLETACQELKKVEAKDEKDE